MKSRSPMSVKEIALSKPLTGYFKLLKNFTRATQREAFKLLFLK